MNPFSNSYMPQMNNFADLNNALYWHYLQVPQQNALQQYLANNLRFSKDLKFNGDRQLYNGKMFAKHMQRQQQQQQQPNSSCIMYELGYVNERSEIDLTRINWKIHNLTIPDYLKQNLLEGVQFCYQFSKCVPEFNLNNAPLSKELSKPNFFLRCYKHKKIEACIMKDIRERFAKQSDTEQYADEERPGQTHETNDENANGFDSYFRRNARQIVGDESFESFMFADDNDSDDLF